MKMYNEECKKCGHKWYSRVEKPLACPNCKRYDYDKDEKKHDRIERCDRKTNGEQQKQ